ncbi:GerAB/ArcD/ProY family transporter [Paenibacillus sp. GYB003]|uniref:GerAB/ArcD/ProY family transporter n=1 Tax=Paenibacillus sp. GYB003 TaxID=2994392 RepID=UPI002F96D3A8
MIKLSDGKIGFREFFSLIVFTIGLKLTDTTPTFLFLSGGNAGWLMPVISCLFLSIVLVVMFSILKNNPGKGLLDLTFELTGSAGGFLIGFLFFVILLTATVLNSRSYVSIVNTMVYQRTPVPVLLLLLLAAACFIASRGLETIGRVAWLIFPYAYAIFFVLFFLVWDFIDWLHLFPIAGPGIIPLVKESVFHTSVYGEVIYLLALVPYVRTFADFRKASFIGFGLSIFNIVLAMAVFIAVFDYPAVRDMEYPFQQLTRTAQVGQVISHVESIFLFFWLMCSVVHFAVYLHLIAFLFARTLRIKAFKPFVLPFSGLVLLLGLLPENEIVASLYRDDLIESTSIFYIVLPFILWALDKRKRGRVR